MHFDLARILRISIFAVVAIVVAACGGGGGSRSDTTPEPFSFVAQTDVALSTPFSSTAVTITGINRAAAVTITGGEYAIAGGAFQSTAGEVSEGQSIVVRLTSSASFSTPVSATLRVGGVPAAFTVTTLAQDITPAAFSFTAQTDVALDTAITSNEITVTDINDAAPISIDVGEYRINGGVFTSAAGTVNAGDTVDVRLSSSAIFATPTSAILTIGGVTATFTITTVAQDITPAAFSFTDATGVAQNTATISNAITVTEITGDVAVSIDVGEYRINGGAFTSAAGTVNSGDTVDVNVTSAITAGAAVDATLTIGTVAGTFSVTTLADTTPPQALIVFPTPVTLTDGTQVTLRGKATDDLSAVTSINVRVTTDSGANEFSTAALTASGSDDFITTWSVPVSLAADTLNTIEVTATDAAGNVQAVPTSIQITQDSDGSANPVTFPAGNDVDLGEFRSSVQADIDVARNRILYPGSLSSGPSLISVDINTGVREHLLSSDMIPTSRRRRSLLINIAEDVVYVSSSDNIQSVDLNTLAITSLTDASTPNSDVDLQDIGGLALHSNGTLYAVDRANSTGLIRVDTLTGERRLLAATLANTPSAIYIDEAQNSALVSVFDATASSIKVVSVNLATGDTADFIPSTQIVADLHFEADTADARLFVSDDSLDELNSINLSDGTLSVVSSDAVPASGANTVANPSSVAVNADDDVGFLGDSLPFSGVATVFVVDLNTGERVVLSRHVAP